MKLPNLVNLFKKTAADEPCLVIDLGTHAVKTLIFKPPAVGQSGISILGQASQRQGQTSLRGRQVLDLDAVLEVLDLAIEGACLQAGLTPQKTIFGVSGRWLKIQNSKVRLKRPAPQEEITQKELDFLFGKVSEKLLSEQKDLELVSQKISWLEVEGKRVDSALGLTGATLELIIHTQLAKLEDLKTLHTIANELSLKITDYYETTVAVASSLLNEYPSGMVIDVGGSVTELAIFREGKIYPNQCFNLGGKDLTKAIAESLNLPFDKAEDLKTKFLQNHLDQERAQNLREIVQSELQLWSQALQMTLSALETPKPLPDQIFLCGGVAQYEELTSLLLACPWQKTGLFTTFPKFIRLEENIGLKAMAKISED